MANHASQDPVSAPRVIWLPGLQDPSRRVQTVLSLRRPFSSPWAARLHGWDGLLYRSRDTGQVCRGRETMNSPPQCSHQASRILDADEQSSQSHGESDHVSSLARLQGDVHDALTGAIHKPPSCEAMHATAEWPPLVFRRRYHCRLRKASAESPTHPNTNLVAYDLHERGGGTQKQGGGEDAVCRIEANRESGGFGKHGRQSFSGRRRSGSRVRIGWWLNSCSGTSAKCVPSRRDALRRALDPAANGAPRTAANHRRRRSRLEQAEL